MKYAVFLIAIAGIIPFVLLMLGNRPMMRATVFLISFFALWFDPLSINFFSNEEYRGTSRGLEMSTVYLCAIAVIITLRIWRGKLKWFPDAGVWFYAGYFVCALFSLMNADNLLFSSFEIWKMIMMYFIFVAVWNYLDFSGDFNILWYSIGTVILLNFPVVVYDSFNWVFQAHGVFPHQNSMGMYMTLAGIMFLSIFFNSTGNLSWFAGGVFLTSALSVILTYSRGAILCFPIGCVLTVGVSMLYSSDFRKTLIVGVAALGVLFLLVLFLPKIFDRFERAPESSADTRIDFAIAALNMIEDEPWLGVGVNNWGIRINPPYEYSEHRERMRYHDDYKDGIVETIYLLVAAECGVIAFGFLLLWFGYYLVTSIFLLKKTVQRAEFYIPAGMVGGLTAIYLQSALEWVLKQPVNFVQLMIMFAVISFLRMDCIRRKREERKQKLSMAKAVALSGEV
ncbi:MAG: O-antigen ligase family protein [Victivallales bacterium]|jgi:O-antigen ligase|nr:O-antigen ligase family protein [Victivallales bacterium]